MTFSSRGDQRGLDTPALLDDNLDEEVAIHPGAMSKRSLHNRACSWRGAWVTGIALLGLALLGHGLYIPIKAQVAQLLLQRAWHIASTAGGEPKPWPWADTYPIARLQTRSASYSIDQIILANASGRNLAFGPTHVLPSAVPGRDGHIVISGHRDTHFKWLKGVAAGDQLTLQSADSEQHYRVIGSEIIDLSDSSFNLFRDQSLLSLVTCYPFDSMLPNTSQRYVVHARLVNIEPASNVANPVASLHWAHQSMSPTAGPVRWF